MAITLCRHNSHRFGKTFTESGRITIIKLSTLFLAWFFIPLGHAEITINNDFNYLNQIRKEANLTPFKWQDKLAATAQNHANYLSFNSRHGHREQKNLRYFTGEWVSQRALLSAYPNRMVSENVASKSGDNLFYNPIDSLMSAIYHRFGFLDLSADEIGIGHQQGTINSYVYVMGDSSISQLCGLPDFTDFGEYNFKICADEDQRIEKQLLDANTLKSLSLNPSIILWPANLAQNIPPVFFQENPDPLPHHSVSAYPVSIQFNPAFFKYAPKLNAFSLKKTGSNSALKLITVMNQDNDPNKLLSPYQHALFPKQRLEWGTQYTATADYTNLDNQTQKQLTWSFRTKSFNAPILTMTQPIQKIKVKKGQRYILYFPPRHAQDTLTALKYRDYQMNLKLNYIDKNTLNAYISKNGKAEINFHQKTVILFTE